MHGNVIDSTCELKLKIKIIKTIVTLGIKAPRRPADPINAGPLTALAVSEIVWRTGNIR
jgi:hypothetical protein